jgi:hypothetical protein
VLPQARLAPAVPQARLAPAVPQARLAPAVPQARLALALLLPARRPRTGRAAAPARLARFTMSRYSTWTAWFISVVRGYPARRRR